MLFTSVPPSVRTPSTCPDFPPIIISVNVDFPVHDSGSLSASKHTQLKFASQMTVCLPMLYSCPLVPTSRAGPARTARSKRRVLARPSVCNLGGPDGADLAFGSDLGLPSAALQSQ